MSRGPQHWSCDWHTIPIHVLLLITELFSERLLTMKMITSTYFSIQTLLPRCLVPLILLTLFLIPTVLSSQFKLPLTIPDLYRLATLRQHLGRQRMELCRPRNEGWVDPEIDEHNVCSRCNLLDYGHDGSAIDLCLFNHLDHMDPSKYPAHLS